MNYPTASLCRGACGKSASLLGLVCLASGANAQAPELFIADPALQNTLESRSIYGVSNPASLPSYGSSHGFNYEIFQGQAVLEGDILLGPVNASGFLLPNLTGRGMGLNDSFSRWPNGIVPYAFTDNSQTQRDNIARAMAHWVEKTTISFVERTAANSEQYPNYISFKSTQSCASHVGMLGNGEQPVLVADACTMGSIIHEIGHAIGLFHEHTRPDRDNFVQIDWDLIQAGKQINFDIVNSGVETYGPYDYGSIMHYGERFFSTTGDPVIVVPTGIEIGQRIALSERDIEAANLMYATDLAVAEPITQTTDNGLEIDLTLNNYGTLGAHDLQLLLRLDDNSIWKGVSPESGWDCLTYGPELKCLRDTLAGQNESRFTVLVDAQTTGADSIKMTLSSRTMDTDTSNNGFNDQNVTWQSIEPEPNDGPAEPDTDRDSTQNLATDESLDIPGIGAAELSTDANSQDNSTGPVHPLMIAVLLTLFGWRKRPG